MAAAAGAWLLWPWHGRHGGHSVAVVVAAAVWWSWLGHGCCIMAVAVGGCNGIMAVAVGGCSGSMVVEIVVVVLVAALLLLFLLLLRCCCFSCCSPFLFLLCLFGCCCHCGIVFPLAWHVFCCIVVVVLDVMEFLFS